MASIKENRTSSGIGSVTLTGAFAEGCTGICRCLCLSKTADAVNLGEAFSLCPVLSVQ